MKKPTRKPVRTMKAESKTRTRPSKLVREAHPSSRAKLEAALGFAHSMPPNATGPLQTQEELFGLIRDVHRLGADPLGSDLGRYLLVKTGLAISNAILRKDYLIFQRLAAILQYGKQPRFENDMNAKTYAKYQLFCFHTGTGTEDAPCDAHAMLRWLEMLGVRFSRTLVKSSVFTAAAVKRTQSREIPSVYRKTCNKLGIHFTTSRVGTDKAPRNPDR